ncbi:MAG TPA: hypothetical protein DD666_18650 [Advenella kashmirensis]|uniref:Uncharacterized protein n=1 Tax=Advenella kashmirensis TaxID=310575 RepID=A0A356LLK3_9BURK|nr:hypothetical protein [Advenella kashmirensis]
MRANTLANTLNNPLTNSQATTSASSQTYTRNEPNRPGSVKPLFESTIVRSAWPVLTIFYLLSCDNRTD